MKVLLSLRQQPKVVFAKSEGLRINYRQNPKTCTQTKNKELWVRISYERIEPWVLVVCLKRIVVNRREIPPSLSLRTKHVVV